MDPKIIERMKRIEALAALIKSGKATPADKAEMEKLLKEQMDWQKKNPAAAMEAMQTMKLLKKTPEQMKAEYEAGMAQAKAAGATFDPEESARARAIMEAAGIPESLMPKPVTPPSKFTADQEQARTDYGKAVREKLIAEGKPVAVADAEALKAYRSWYPEMDDRWKPVPAPKVLTPEEAEAYSNPMAGHERPDVPVAPKAEAPVASAPEAPEAPAPEAPVEEDPHAEATMVGAGGGAPAPAEEKPKPKFGDKLKDLYGKYGVPFLEIVEAVGKQRGDIDKPTALDRKYQEKLDKAQKEYMERLEKEREAREESTYQKRIAEERKWQAEQAAANRAADTAARREELTAREKLLQMQLAAQKGAAATGGASIIPQ